MTAGDEEDYLLLSGLQHFAFCPRQWALIHIENQWHENKLTAEGVILHEKVHDDDFSEKRGDVLTLRSLRVVSHVLGVTGMCDAVEFNRAQEGAVLHGRKGQWLPFPVEYKRGKPKSHRADELQLCCQAMCLEEMLSCAIPRGALFYFGDRHRTEVIFDHELRSLVLSMIVEMHALFNRGYTPKVKRTSACKSCSLVEQCLPALFQQETTSGYFRRRMEESNKI